MDPYERLLIKVLKVAVRDYIKGRNLRDVKAFFSSNYFRKIVLNFDTDPDEFLHSIYYYKSYFIKTGKVQIKVKKGKLTISDANALKSGTNTQNLGISKE